MKKTILLLLFLIATSSYTFHEEETGPCMIQVKSMPFWTFWNRSKIINAIAEKTQFDSETVRMMIKDHLAFYVWEGYEEAEKFKIELEQLNCDVEIIVDLDDEATIAATQCEIMKLASTEEGQEVLDFLNKMGEMIGDVVAQHPGADLNEQRALILQALEASEETED